MASASADDPVNTLVKPKAPGAVTPVLFAVVAAAFAYFVTGFNTGVIAGALLFIIPEFGLEEDPAIEGLITSMTIYGMLVGVTISMTSLGRRVPLLVGNIFYIAGGALMFWSPNVEVLITGRFLVGYAAGVTTVNVPLYVAECSPADRRGVLVSSTYMFGVVGILASYVMNFILTMSGSSNWRLMLGALCIPAAIDFCMLLFLPESPRFLVQRKFYSKAYQILARLRGTSDIDEEFRSIVHGIFPNAMLSYTVATESLVDGMEPAQNPKMAINDETSPLIRTNDQKAKWYQPIQTLLFKKDARTALVICVFLELFQQFTGIQAVSYYTPVILDESGINDMFAPLGINDASAAMLGSIIVYCTQLLPMYLGMRYIDSIGRRSILLLCGPFIVVSLVGLGVSDLIINSAVGAAIALGSIIIYKCSYSPGLGLCPPVIESEIFPVEARATGMMVVSFCGILFQIAVLQTFPFMKAGLGLTWTFILFAAFSIVTVFFIYFFIPETKQTTLEDAHKILESKTSSDEENLN